MGASLIWDVEQPVERVESDSTRQQPAEHGGCKDEYSALDHREPALPRACSQTAVCDSPSSTDTGGE